MPERPTSVSVSAILLIIFGSMALMGLITTAMTMSGTSSLTSIGGGANPALVAMQQSPGYMLYMKLMIVPSVLGAALAITAGIQLLKGREWARRGGQVWAVWSMLNGLGGLWAAMTYVTPAIETMAPPFAMKPDELHIYHMTMKVTMLVGTGLAAVMALALPIVLLVMLSRPLAVAFCRRLPSRSRPPPIA